MREKSFTGLLSFMPWKSSDVLGKTKKATSSVSKKQWTHVANSVLNRGGSDSSAIRQANAVIKNRFGHSSESEAKSSAKRLSSSKSSGGRSRTSSTQQPEGEEKRTKKFIKRYDPKRMFRTDVNRRSTKTRMRGR